MNIKAAKAVFSFFLAAGVLAASNITVEQTGVGTPVDTAVVQGVGPHGSSLDVYIGPYTLSLDGGPSVAALCVDPFDENQPGDKWTAAVTNVATGPFTNTKNPLGTTFDGTHLTASQLYTDDAEIFYLLENDPNVTKTDRTDLQIEAWGLVDPTVAEDNTAAMTAAYNFGVDAYESGALDGFNANNFEIVTDSDGQGRQEFIVASSAPEPMSLALMGLGLIGFFGISKLRKRMQASQQA